MFYKESVVIDFCMFILVVFGLFTFGYLISNPSNYVKSKHPIPTVKPSGKFQIIHNNQTYFTNENPQVLYEGQCVLIRVNGISNLFCGNFQVIGNLEPVK